jgi:hypothetical protein
MFNLHYLYLTVSRKFCGLLSGSDSCRKCRFRSTLNDILFNYSRERLSLQTSSRSIVIVSTDSKTLTLRRYFSKRILGE